MPPEVLAENGIAYLADPETGLMVEVPVERAQEAIGLGFRPVGADEYGQRKLAEWNQQPAQQLGAATLGFTRGLTGGLSDVAARATGGTEGAAMLQRLKEANPNISLGSEIGGTVAGVAATGLGSGTAHLGTRAAGLAGRIGSKGAQAALPRLVGTLAREGTLGAAMGLGQGTSDLALTAPDDITLAEAAHHLAAATGKGAAIGAGLGAAGWGIGTAARKVKARYTLGVGEIKKLRGERTALQADMEKLAASGATEAQLMGVQTQLAEVSTKLAGMQTKAVGKMLTRAMAYGVGHAVGGGLTGGLLGVVIAPRLLKSMGQMLRAAGGGKAGKVVAQVKAAAKPYWEKAAPVVQEALSNPAVRAAANQTAGGVSKAAGAGVGKLAGSQAGHMVTDAVGHGLGTGIGALAAGDAVGAGLMAGGATGAAVAYGAHALQKPIGQAIEILTHKIAPAAQAAAIAGLSKVELDDLAGELDHVDPTLMDATMKGLLPESMPAPIKEAVTGQVMTAVQFLQQEAPKRPDQDRIASGATHTPTESEMRRYRRSFKAVVQPDSVVEDFIKGRLHKDQVRAWQAVYPQALEQLRSTVRAEMARTAANGGKYDRAKAAQIATLLGDKSLTPRMYDPKTVARAQAMHQQAQEKPGPKPRARQMDLASGHQTTMQRVRGG